jgi:hypothetical protein
MPRVLPNNKQWMRGGHINQKRLLSMNEDEKANVARCQGIKSEHPCKKPIFRCAECGNYGCDQEVVDKCTAQGFKNDKCLNCGVTGSRIPVMEKELANFKELWEREVPVIERK